MGEPIEITYTVLNTGSSAAQIVESVISVDVQHWESPRRVPLPAGKNAIGVVTINAGEAKTFTYAVPDRPGTRTW